MDLQTAFEFLIVIALVYWGVTEFKRSRANRNRGSGAGSQDKDPGKER